MEKVYFRDNEKMSIIDAMLVMKNLLKNSKLPIIDDEMLQVMRRKFVKCYTTLENATEPTLTLEIAKLYQEDGIYLDIDELKMSCLQNGIIMQQVFQSLTPEQLNMYNKSKEIIRNSFIYDFIYEYLEENLKKSIVSEIFKVLVGNSGKFNVTIKVTSERLEKIFENESIKNKEYFFCQQLETWSLYNNLAPLSKVKVIAREEDESKKDVFIYINLLEGIPHY